MDLLGPQCTNCEEDHYIFFRHEDNCFCPNCGEKRKVTDSNSVGELIEKGRNLKQEITGPKVAGYVKYTTGVNLEGYQVADVGDELIIRSDYLEDKLMTLKFALEAFDRDDREALEEELNKLEKELGDE